MVRLNALINHHEIRNEMSKYRYSQSSVGFYNKAVAIDSIRLWILKLENLFNRLCHLWHDSYARRKVL